MRSIRAGLSRVTAQPLMSAAGPWSLMPVHEVSSTLTRPSERGTPGCTPRRSQSRSISGLLAGHAVDDVVAEQHVEAPARLAVQEGVELHDRLHLHRGHPERLRDVAEGGVRHVAAGILHVPQDLQQVLAVRTVAVHQLLH